MIILNVIIIKIISPRIKTCKISYVLAKSFSFQFNVRFVETLFEAENDRACSGVG